MNAVKRVVLLSGLSMIFLSGVSHANTIAQCPSAAVIQKNEITHVIGYLPGLYMGTEENTFGTPMEWRFNIGPMVGHTEIEVLQKLNEALQGISGPISTMSVDQEVLCVYKTASPSNTAIATPLVDE